MSIPEFLPDPAIATRLAFRLIYPDTRSISSGPTSSSNSPGRFLSKDLGSVVVGDGGPGVLPADEEVAKIVAGGPMAGRLGGDPEFMLKDARFVIGDYIAVAILPPLGNGNIAPMLNSGPAPGMGMGRGGRVTRPGEMDEDHHFSGGSAGRLAGPRENGFGGFRVRGGRGWGGPPGSGGGPRGVALPSGEWRRGERLPDGPPGMGGRGGFGGGRGRDRW
jgi:histone deacetylase complex subunit SAP18